MDNQLLFALDIGTRSVVGLVGEMENNTIKLLATEREEHHTRAMLDGQIHDVQEVAQVLASVKTRLESTTGGKLTKVAVAAAGRALCTLRASASLDTSTRGALTADDERSLEMAAIQTAQAELASSGKVPDPADYYCVGYSVISYTLDGTRIRSLIGQRGKQSSIETIATFLPRQVIDSLQSAIQNVGLEISTLTLEPIAAISVLIPTTMRHLNLVLIDVGAGTSDVAITRDGSVIAYGMVPIAGDEITEAISQKFLLDFNIAETVKRQLGNKNKKITFNDVLGLPQKVEVQTIIDVITPKVGELAQSIAAEIMKLNNECPQAVLLVGGGALTPLLPESLAEALAMPPSRVAIRHPENIEGISNVPDTLRTPDSVTPLGILKLAGGRTLNFVNIIVNERAIRLFNLNKLTISDALLAAGIDIRALRGRPGMGLTVSVNGTTRFIPGSHGSPGQILVNGQPARLMDALYDKDTLEVNLGTEGTAPASCIKDIVEEAKPLAVTVDGKDYLLELPTTINGVPAARDTLLHDRDQIFATTQFTLTEALTLLKLAPDPTEYVYNVNGVERTYTTWPKYTVDNTEASSDTKLVSGSRIEILQAPPPTLAEVLGINTDASEDAIKVSFNGSPCVIPIQRHTVLIDGRRADINLPAVSGSNIVFTTSPNLHPLISDVLLAAEFDPLTLPVTARVSVLLNDVPTEYTALVNNGDSIQIRIIER